MRTRLGAGPFFLALRIVLLCFAALIWPWEGHAEPLHRLVEPVKLVVRAALVAPLKTNGNQWDLGGGDAPYEARAQAALPFGRDSQRQLFQALDRGAPNEMLSRVRPLAVQAMVPGACAPDIAGAVVLDGVVIRRLPKVQDAYHAMWPHEPTDPIAFRDDSRLVISVWDVDVVSDDRVGTCVIDGQPAADANGYIASENYNCTGQLWAVSIQALPTSEADVIRAIPPERLAAAMAKMTERSRVMETRNTMKTIENAVVQWQTESSDPCPPNLGSLMARKILSKVPEDGWGKPMSFKCPGVHDSEIDLASAGPDGKFNTSDDINSWDDPAAAAQDAKARRKELDVARWVNYQGSLDSLRLRLHDGLDTKELKAVWVGFVGTVSEVTAKGVVIMGGTPLTYCATDSTTALRAKARGTMVYVVGMFSSYDPQALRFTSCRLAEELKGP